MIAILGWVLFAATIVVAVWRDFHEQAEAEKGYQEDVRYWEAKQKEWLAEKRKLVSRLRKIERAMRDI